MELAIEYLEDRIVRLSAHIARRLGEINVMPENKKSYHLELLKPKIQLHHELQKTVHILKNTKC